MSKHKQPGGIWTAQYAHCAVYCMMPMMIITIFEQISQFLTNLKLGITWLLEVRLRK